MKTQSLNVALLKDVGILLFLCFMLLLFVCVSLAPETSNTLYLALTMVVLLCAAMALLGNSIVSILMAGTLTCIWVSYKLFDLYALGGELLLSDYLFIPLPLLVAGSAQLYHYTQTRIEAENNHLRQQVENLVLVNEITQLYNLRALYREMPLQLRYHQRIRQPLSLMIIQLRYGPELKHMLSTNRYNALIQRLADIVQDALRVEDRLYSIDDDGSLAILLATNKVGFTPVINRIRAAIATGTAFHGILDDHVEVAIRIGGKEFPDGDVDSIAFKKSVESELVYDV